jgi:NarL family two-component system response regulator LiaR
VSLTPTEEIVHLKILEGKSNQEIADDMVVSINTIKTHVGRILKKEKVKNRVQLISNQFKNK